MNGEAGYDPEMWNVGNPGSTGVWETPGYPGAVERNRLLLQQQNQPMGLGGTMPGSVGTAATSGDLLAQPPAATPPTGIFSGISSWMDRPLGENKGAALGISKALADFGVAVSQDPNNPIFGNLTKLASSLIGGVQQSELRKKLATQQGIGGGQDPTQGPGASQFGISDFEALGLTSEQVTGLYDTALKTREAEREYPLKATKTYADAIQSLQAGDLASATAAATRLETEMKSDPARQTVASLTELNKLYKAIAETAGTRATTRETEAKTRGKELETGLTETFGAAEREAKLATERAEPGLKRAQTVKAWTEQYKTEEEIRQSIYGLSPTVEQQRTRMEINKQVPFGATTVDGNLVITNHRTGSYQSYPLGTRTPESRVTQLGWSMAASTFLNQAKADLAAKYPQNIQKAQDEYSAILFTLGKEGVTADVQGSAIRGALNDSNKLKFDRSMDIYRDGEKRGWSLETMTRAVQDELGIKGQQAGQPFAGESAAPPLARRIPVAPGKAGAPELNAIVPGTNKSYKQYLDEHKNNAKAAEAAIRRDQQAGAK